MIADTGDSSYVHRVCSRPAAGGAAFVGLNSDRCLAVTPVPNIAEEGIEVSLHFSPSPAVTPGFACPCLRILVSLLIPQTRAWSSGPRVTKEPAQ